MQPGNPELLKLLEYGAYGFTAALIGSMSKSRGLTLPHIMVRRLRDGKELKVWDPGFLSAPFLGGILAAYMDTSPQNAIAWGLAASFAGPSIINTIVDGLLKKLGLIVGGLPEPAVTTTPNGGTP